MLAAPCRSSALSWVLSSRLAGLRSVSSSAQDHITDEHSIVGGYTPVTKQLWAERLRWTPKALEQAAVPKNTTAKPAKRIAVSYPFSTDKSLKEVYRNPWGYVRTGRLLEDLDSLAGNVAFDHCYGNSTEGVRPPLLVTASVDAITLRDRLPIDQDLIMSGQVVWTGKSSLDIRMEVSPQGRATSSLVALFSFVALDPVSKRPQGVNQVLPSGVEAQALFRERQLVSEQRRAARKLQAQGGASLLPGSQHLEAGAQKAAEVLLQQGRQLVDMPGLAAGDCILMRDTVLENTFVCQPQQRNMHGRVFGGFLMRRAFELAFATTYMYAGVRPMFVEVDEVTFKSPVDVGDLLRLSSSVLLSHPDPADPARSLVRVEVAAGVTRPEDVESRETNTFSFVFAVAPRPDKPLKRVLPATHLEALSVAPFLLPPM